MKQQRSRKGKGSFQRTEPREVLQQTPAGPMSFPKRKVYYCGYCDIEFEPTQNVSPVECPYCGSTDENKIRLVESESDRKPRKEKGNG